MRASLVALALVASTVFAAGEVALDGGKRLHVAIMSIPCYGHVLPLKAVGEQLLLRGHRVSMFSEHASWCESIAGTNASQPGVSGFNCEVMPSSSTFGPAVWKKMSKEADMGQTFLTTFEEMTLHQREQLAVYVERFSALHKEHPVDVVLQDLSTFVAADVATKFDLPRVSMLPLVMHMVAGPATWLPSLGTAFPANMNFAQRFINFLIKLLTPIHGFWMLDRLNAVRSTQGIAPYRSMLDVVGAYGPVMAPTVWGYDIPQPLCPNIRPLGIVTALHGHSHIEDGLKAFLESEQCATHGAVYVNFGTLAWVNDRLFEVLERVLLAKVGHNGRVANLCVVWKVTEADRRATLRKELSNVDRTAEEEATATDAIVTKRFYVTKRFSDPPEIMAHPSMKAFVTHCGDTSLGEAVEAGVPLVGIPIFADQADVCQRMQERGIGVYVGPKFEVTEESFLKSLGHAVNPAGQQKMRGAIKEMQAMSAYLGGPAAGAEFLETTVREGITGHFSCGSLQWQADGAATSWWRLFVEIVRVQQYDVFILFGLVPVYLTWIVLHRVGRAFVRRFLFAAPGKEKKE